MAGAKTINPVDAKLEAAIAEIQRQDGRITREAATHMVENQRILPIAKLAKAIRAGRVKVKTEAHGNLPVMGWEAFDSWLEDDLKS